MSCSVASAACDETAVDETAAAAFLANKEDLEAEDSKCCVEDDRMTDEDDSVAAAAAVDCETKPVWPPLMLLLLCLHL